MPDDVLFTWINSSTGKQESKTLKGTEMINSREAIGIWKVDNKSWKVYGTTSQLKALSDDYTRAQVDAGLPVGNPAPAFQQGTVKVGSGNPTQGFVLIVEWMDGKNFQKNATSFRKALEGENISHDPKSQDYTRIASGCAAANKVGLVDCQGYVKAGNYEPVRFVDVHTSWNSQTQTYRPSEQAQALVDEITAWAH